VADQITSLEERWPEIKGTLENWFKTIFERFPWMQEHILNFDFGKYVSSSISGLIRGFRLGLVAISGAVFALFIGLYTAVNGEEYFDKTVQAFYPAKREKARFILGHCAKVIRKWFKAQLVDMVIIGVMTGAGLWIAGIEYWAVFGLLTAVLGIIPYVGIIQVVFAASLITLSTDPSKVPWVLAIFAITQQVEGDVVLPLVMKGGAQLPVVPLLIFMLFLGSFFGIIGVFIAPPLLAVLRTLYIDIYLPYVSSQAGIKKFRRLIK
jgi:predicted PurR-regulated permease PerM